MSLTQRVLHKKKLINQSVINQSVILENHRRNRSRFSCKNETVIYIGGDGLPVDGGALLSINDVSILQQ